MSNDRTYFHSWPTKGNDNKAKRRRKLSIQWKAVKKKALEWNDQTSIIFLFSSKVAWNSSQPFLVITTESMIHTYIHNVRTYILQTLLCLLRSAHIMGKYFTVAILDLQTPGYVLWRASTPPSVSLYCYRISMPQFLHTT